MAMAMATESMYHEGMRRLQDGNDSRRLADRLQQLTLHAVFSEADRAFVEASSMLFLATADSHGQPDCSYKGGLPGFVQVLADEHDRLLEQFPGAQRMVRVQATHIFPNCPRYIHRLDLQEPSAFAPRANYTPPVPQWKSWDALSDVLPRSDR